MTDVIEIYHAATERIETPDCRRGRRNLDFGQGFYLTDIYDQALVWATRKSMNAVCRQSSTFTYLTSRRC